VEIGIGQKYGFKVNNFQIPTNAGAAMNIFELLAAASIPVLIQRFVITSASSTAQTVPVSVQIRSAAGSGGSTTLAGTDAEPPSGSNATETLAYNVTTQGGSLVKEVAAAFWQIFMPYEFNRKPGGLLITPGNVFCLATPATGVGTAFNASIEGEYIALK
jgi:hypothetical protein